MERTAAGIVSVFKQVVFSEFYAKKTGLMQRIDPRVKLVSIIAFIVSLSIVDRIEVVFAAYALMLILAYCSQIQVLFFVKRVWLFIPIFTAVITAPAIFNFITPGRALLVLFELPKTYQLGLWTLPRLITITEPGLKGALLFTTRVATSVSAAVLLTLTTSWSDLLRSLRVLRVPVAFITVLGMTYRYIILFLRTVEEMHLARKSRTIAKLSSRENRFWVAGRIAATFKKSLKLSEDVHSAMVARGFSDEPKVLRRFSFEEIDALWLVGAVLVCTLLIALTIRMSA